MQQDVSLELEVEEIVNEAQVKPGYAPEGPIDPSLFALWQSRYTTPQKQAGLFLVRIPLQCGVLYNEDALALADLAENFGDNSIRLSPDQNFNLKNIPLEYLGNVFNKVQNLKTQSHIPALLGNMVACTGAATCALGLTQSRPLLDEIQKELLRRDLELDRFAQVKFNLSGCPNACGNNHVADIGLFGKALKKSQALYPAYTLQLGGFVHDAGSQAASQVATVPAKFVPQVLGDFFASYEARASELGDFRAWIQSEAAQLELRELAQSYEAQLPELSEDESFYFDWHDEARFSLLKGKKAECSAGLYDLIDYDFDKIKKLNKAFALDPANPGQVARDLTLHATRALLVTRGIEPGNDTEVFDAFLQDFLEAGLVPAQYKELVALARKNDLTALQNRVEEAEALGKYMKHLYESMDDSLRFHLPRQVAAPQDKKTEKEAPSANGDLAVYTSQATKFRDFRGVSCPMNFVKTKIALDPMAPGETLEIWLDDGQPIANVPNSVELEGHEILQQDQQPEGYWSVLVKKA